MDIEQILNSLGLDLTNPEVKRGVKDAIDAIIKSRAPMPSIPGMPGAGGEVEVELDPDLVQPSIKNNQQSSSADDSDVEIQDDDNVLSSIKHNGQDTTPQQQQDDGSSTSANADGSEVGSEAGSSSENSNTANATNQSTADPLSTDSDIDKPDVSDANNDTNADSDKTRADRGTDTADTTGDNTATDVNAGDESEAGIDAGTVEDDAAAPTDSANVDSADTTDTAGDGTPTDADAQAKEKASDATTDEDDYEVDETDIFDNATNFEDEAVKKKHEARKIKRERTLAAAKTALADAKAKGKSQSLINELEKAIDALEGLQEAVNKNLRDMSDEEFNLVVNRVFDAIDALGDSGLTYTSNEDRETKVKEIKADIDNTKTRAELSAEDIAKIRAEHQAIKAREKEAAKYVTKSPGQFKGFQDFLNSLYRAIALQVAAEEARDDTWSAINRRYGGTGVLKQGQRIDELPNKKIPVIDFYFDQSASWSERDVRVGEQAVSALADMQEKGKIKINVYYFSNNVHTNAQAARNEGGTWAWNEIVKNVIATQATNVVIMTDEDMEDRYDIEGHFSGRERKAMTYTVPGYVWYLWKHGENAPRLPRDLKGRGGVQQFSF